MATKDDAADLAVLRRKPVVLVVDDDMGQAAQIATFLVKRGIPSLPLTSAKEALVAMERDRPVVMIVDVNMPGMSGIELARIVKGLAVKPKIVLMSGQPELVADANRAGLEVFATVDKPVPLRVLELFVRRAMAAAAVGRL